MIIRSLKLKNYRRFVDCELEFPEGIIGLVGNNGAGKSTLMESLGWALFGNNAARSAKDEIRYSASSASDECQVMVDFELDNEQFRIVRQLRGRTHSGDASIFSGKNLLAKSTTAVNEEVQRLLGLDLKNFEISFFAKQKELNALSDLTPGEREKHIIKLLGISDVDEAIKLIRDDHRNGHAKIAVNETVIASMTVMETDIALAHAESLALETRIKNAEENVQQLKGTLSNAIQRFAETAELREQYLEIKNESEKLNGRIDAEGKKLGDLRDEAKTLCDYQDRAAILRDKTARYDEVKGNVERQNELALKHSKLISAQSTRDQLGADLHKLEDYISDLNREIEALANIDELLLRKNIELKRLYALRSRHQDICSKINQVKFRLESKKTDLDGLRKQAETLHQHIENAAAMKGKISDYDILKVSLERQNESALKHSSLMAAAKNRGKLVSECNSLQAYVDGMTKEISTLAGIESVLLQRMDELKSINIVIKSHRSYHTALQAESRAFRDGQERTRIQLADIEKLGPDSKCDRCLRTFGDYYEEIRAHFESELDFLAKAIGASDAKLCDIESTIEKENNRKDSIEEDIRNLNKEQSRLKQIQKTTVRDVEGLETLRLKIRELEDEIAGLGEVQYDTTRHGQIREQFEQASKQRDEYIRVMASINSLADIPGKIKETESAIEIMTKQATDLESDLSAIGYDENALESAERELRECNNMKARLIQVQKTLKREETVLHALEIKIKELDVNIAMYSGVIYSPEEHKNMRAEFEELSGLRDDYLRITSSINSLEDVPVKIAETEAIIINLKTQANLISERLSSITYSDELFAAIQKEKEKAQVGEHEAELALRDLTSDLKLKHQELQNLRNEIDRKTLLIEETKVLGKRASVLKLLDKLFGDFRQDLIGRIRPALSRRGTYYLDLLTDGKYSELEVGEGYSLYINDGGVKYEINRFSGGEKDIANLCLRLAISELTHESRESIFSFIVLDEIFGSLDDNRRNAVLNALGNLKKHFRQIFVITHLDDIKDRLEYSIMIEERPDGTSTATYL
ncbi:MAG: hypothetical protein CO189_05525 [candidate division Zixibacteria bacterium CG_4_9_14_3_um_filter_46_8]|nr:MAG: hypothetical protein CO189_05525 [candidate division Zixibacteria bacterium CG_4_9_14_3_um_filter_46_8]